MDAAHDRLLAESAARSLRSALVVALILTIALLVLDPGVVPRPAARDLRGSILPHRNLVPDAGSEAPRAYVPPIWVIPPKSHEFDRRDEAPVRNPDIKPKLLSSVPPRYPEEARRAHISGVVMIEVVVEADGTISRAHVLKALPFGLTRAAVESLREWRYEPGYVDGKPVPTIAIASVWFRWPPEGE